jgi:hypothetical protein
MLWWGSFLIGLSSSLCCVHTHAACWKELLIMNAYTPGTQNNSWVGCEGLTADEHQFAYGLTEENRKLFCSRFTSTQRAAAMQMTSQPDPTGALISPNQAVVIVAHANQVLPFTNSAAGCSGK